MPDELPELYRVLQVDPTADPDVVQAAYRVLARKLHPDLVGDEEGMKVLNAAWEVLRDPQRRARYDRDRGGATRAEGRATAAPDPSSSRTFVPDHAGPPPGNPYGPVVGFGRYEGWSLGESRVMLALDSRAGSAGSAVVWLFVLGLHRRDGSLLVHVHRLSRPGLKPD